MKNKTQQTAMVLAGVAAVGAAAAWLGRRHLRLVPPPSDTPRIEPPPIEAFLVEGSAAWDAKMDAEVAPDTVPSSVPAPSSTEDISDLWRVEPELTELNEGDIEGYDAVAPEDLGSVWLSRATQTGDGAPGNRLLEEELVLDLSDDSLGEASNEDGSMNDASPDSAAETSEHALDVLEAMERTTERSGTKARHADSKAKKNHAG